MKPYIGLVHKGQGSAYGISFPDAPGCFSAADDLDDVFGLAQEALSVWIETMHEDGISVLPTRDLSAIKADPAWAESFSDAVLVIAIEPPSPLMREAA